MQHLWLHFADAQLAAQFVVPLGSHAVKVLAYTAFSLLLQANDRARALAELAAQRAALEEAALPLMLEAMWAANRLDIQHTVKAVCQEVCALHGVLDRRYPVEQHEQGHHMPVVEMRAPLNSPGSCFAACKFKSH